MTVYTKIWMASDPSTTLEQEIDAYHALNRRILEETWRLGEAVLARVLTGEKYTPTNGLPQQLTGLEATLDAVTNYVDELRGIDGEDVAILREKKDGLVRTLRETTRQLHYLFTFGYHQPAMRDSTVDSPFIHPLVREPFDHFRKTLAAGSSPHPTISSLATLEDYIRYVHEKAAYGFGEITKQLSDDGRLCGIRYTHSHWNISRKHSPALEAIAKSPMGIVLEALEHYNRGLSEFQKYFASGFITKRSFWWMRELGYHMSLWHVLYDAPQNVYDVRFELGEPGCGDFRIEYCAALFPLEGFTHKRGFNWHQARQRVQSVNIHRVMTFLLFAADNLDNLDIDSPRFKPEELVERFDILYGYQMRTQGKTKGKQRGTDGNTRRLHPRKYTAQEWGLLNRNVDLSYGPQI